jgi:FkbM family methyltransferase
MNNIIDLNNKFKKKLENHKKNLEVLLAKVNNNKQYNQTTKNIAVKSLVDEYNNKIQDFKNQYNIDSYDLRYNDVFNENETDNILKDLIHKNISHVKKWDTTQIIDNLPHYCALIEIKNKHVQVIKCNISKDSSGDYDYRFLPFINYLKTIDLTNVNVKFILFYHDNISIAKIKKDIDFTIPILCSTLSDNCRKIYNNTVLIPNMYYYSKNIPIDEMKMYDIEYKNKKKTMIFCGSSTNKLRLAFTIWASKKNRHGHGVFANLTSLFGFKENGYEKYYSEKNISIKEQLQHKFLVSIDGVSSSWNGLIWKLYSNSLVFKLKQEYYEYWYSLLNKTNIFQCNTFDEMYYIMHTINEKNDNIKEMHRNKKKLAKLMMSNDFNKRYLREILLELTKIQNSDRDITKTYDTQYGKITLYSNEIYIGATFNDGKYWDEDTLYKMKEYIDPNRNILEIGGHCGTSTIVYSSFLNKDKKVFVCEPQKKMYDLLIHNINQNELQDKIVPYNLGVFCYNGQGIMNDIDIDGGGGVVEKRYNEEHFFDCNFGGIGLGGKGENVQLTTIDDMDLDDIGFIHCDAQGAENFIFSTGLETITKYRPVILFEDNINNEYYGKPLYDNVCKNYPEYSENSLFDIKKYCMETLNYSSFIENFNGSLDMLLIP